MAKNVALWGAVYTDTPALTVPVQGGGTALFVDTSDANAAASDIASGKTAYVNGEKVTGTYVPNTPTGTIEISENNTYDVSSYASANVNVPLESSWDDGTVTLSHVTASVSGTTVTLS